MNTVGTALANYFAFVLVTWAALAALLVAPASAQPSSFTYTGTAAPTPQISPVISPAAPVMPIFPVHSGREMVVPLIPTDYTNFSMGMFNSNVSMPNLNPGEAVQKISGIPSLEQVHQDEDGILVRSLENAHYTRPSLASVKLDSGSILVSVRRPSKLGLICTPQADVSVSADADVIVTYDDGLLRVLNLTGHGPVVKIKIHSSDVSSKIISSPTSRANSSSSETQHEPNISQPVAIAVKVGHEIVSSDHPLTRADLHPHDGIGRRRFGFIESNVLAVSEFSLESVLTTSDLLVDLSQKTSGIKERRIMGDLSKMAAVLNYMNGQQGFVSNVNQQNNSGNK